MRFQVEVPQRDELDEKLRVLALEAGHRAVREHGNYLLLVKIAEVWADRPAPLAEPA